MRTINTWEKLKEKLFERLRLTQEGTLSSRLMMIKQEGMYTEYLKRFESYSAKVTVTTVDGRGPPRSVP